MTPAWQDLVVELNTKVDVLNDRFDRHADSHAKCFETVFKKLDDLKDSQHRDKEQVMKEIATVRVESVRESGMTNAKVAGLSGTISLIVGFVTAWFTEKLAK